MAIKNYKIIKNFISEEECDRIYNKMLLLKGAGEGGYDPICTKSWSFYSFASPEFIDKVKDKFEELFETELMYTFDYSRIYGEGEVLIPHTDRTMCQYATTINVRNTGEPWTFYVRDPDTKEDISINMTKGDAVLYRGSEITHWREPLTGPDVYQTMIFYCTPELFDAQDITKKVGEEGYSKEVGLFKEKRTLSGLFRSKDS